VVEGMYDHGLVTDFGSWSSYLLQAWAMSGA
jgi:hypothetical protein